KPDCCSTPLLLGPPIATPFPNPALATTPGVAPPTPLPCPDPVGKSNDPAWPILTAPPRFSLAGTPLGSPNPPVWIAAAGLVVVGLTGRPFGKVLVARTLGVAHLERLGSLLAFFF